MQVRWLLFFISFLGIIFVFQQAQRADPALEIVSQKKPSNITERVPLLNLSLHQVSPRRSEEANHSLNSSFPHLCEAKLRKAGLWRNWTFAQTPSSQRPVISLWPRNLSCMTDLRSRDMVLDGHGGCMPMFEWDSLFSVILRTVPGINRSNVILDSKFSTLSQGAIYIYSQSKDMSPIRLLAKALRMCDAGATLVHFSDERSSQTPGYADWSLVLRNYWNKGMVDDPKFQGKVMVMPLGVAWSFWMHDAQDRHGHPERLPTVWERNYTWSFYGDIKKSTRRSMESAMATVPGGFSYASHGFAGKDMIAPYKVRETLMRSLFCPAPTGWINPDTFRFSEALDAGCFPIVDAGQVKKGYFTEFFERYDGQISGMDYIMQVPNKKAWSHVPSHIDKAMMNVTALEARRAAMVLWWKQFKENLGQEVADRILRLKHGMN